jgi:hypothetical protein
VFESHRICEIIRLGRRSATADAMTANHGAARTLTEVKRISPIIILGAIAAFLLMRRREADVVVPDSAWNPVDPS